MWLDFYVWNGTPKYKGISLSPNTRKYSTTWWPYSESAVEVREVFCSWFKLPIAIERINNIDVRHHLLETLSAAIYCDQFWEIIFLFAIFKSNNFPKCWLILTQIIKQVGRYLTWPMNKKTKMVRNFFYIHISFWI